MRTIFILIAIILLFNLAATLAYADSYTYYTHDSIETINVTKSNGTALAIATSQINMDWSTEKWQFGLGVGSFDNNDAISFGLGKRLGRTLINGSVGREGGKYGYGVGVNLRF